uniref:Serine protease 62 n=1 Tax=Mamestra configurata TaxID=174822 RepID=E7D014_9NEOP|nr:serine protease 62 [Mamestra configurata]
MRFLIALTLLGSALAGHRSPSRIVGGSPTNIETYPYMSVMQRTSTGFFWSLSCGGSLLTSTSILSAAHCFYGDQLWQWRSVLGTSTAHSGGTVHPLSRIIMHPEYDDPMINNDVAIVKLSSPAVFSDRIKIARIPGPNYILPDGAAVTHVGWGRLWTGGPTSEQLMHVQVNVINQQLCAERYAYLKTQPRFEHWPDITDGMVCAGILDVGGKDACGGDSGGPLAQFGDIIVGVTSWGFECADAFYPGVSARVTYFSNWITANAN